MAVIVESRRLGEYCAFRLGDDPFESARGCRYFVYVGKGCEAWLDYHDLDVALIENPGQPVFDRASMEDIVREDLRRIGETRGRLSAVQIHLQRHLFEMLRDLGVRDPMILWHFLEALWRAENEEVAQTDEDRGSAERSRGVSCPGPANAGQAF